LLAFLHENECLTVRLRKPRPKVLSALPRRALSGHYGKLTQFR
jgi:hypothetical protein